MKIICPKCQSGNARKLSLIYQENVFNTKSRTTHRINGSLFHSAVSHRSGTSVSLLGKSVAPPMAPSRMHGIPKIIVLWFLVSLFAPLRNLLAPVSYLLLLFLLIYLIVKQVRKNRQYFNIYPQLKRQYDNSYLCQRCGTVFEVRG